MTTAEKVSLVRSAREQYPLSAALAAVDLPRSTFYYWERERRSYAEKYAHLKAPLEAIARKHSAYGYRRTAVELRETYGERVSRKVIRRLHRLWDLPLARGTRRPKPSGIREAITAAGDRINLVAQLHSVIEPFEVLYTDFTELVYAGGAKKAWLIPIVDHASKLACGFAVGDRVTETALLAWERSLETLAALGRSPAGVIVHHDQDPVFTSYRWTSRLLLDDGTRLSYALDGARDNPAMESFNGRFKVENRSLFLDAEDLADLTRVAQERIDYYNRERRHSSLGYRSPMEYLRSLQSGG